MHSARWLKPWSQHRRGGERGTSEQMARRKAKCKRRSAEMVGHITEWDADAMQLKGNGLHEGSVLLRSSLLSFHVQRASLLVLLKSPPSNISFCGAHTWTTCPQDPHAVSRARTRYAHACISFHDSNTGQIQRIG